MAINCDADIMVLGGAAGGGKSYLLNLMCLRYIHDPNWNGILFRKNSTQLMGQGGLFYTGVEIFTQLPKKHRPHIIQSKMKIEFPSGSILKYHHLEYEKDKYSHQGLTK